MLSALTQAGSQPLTSLYLSQIPYTGLDLGPVGTAVYWMALVLFALAAAYIVLFGVAPTINRSLANFGSRVAGALNAPHEREQYAKPVTQSAQPSAPVQQPEPVADNPVSMAVAQALPTRGYSTYEGFKSYAQNGVLSIDDVVKSLSRNASASAAPQKTDSVAQSAAVPAAQAAPSYQNVEPIYDNVETIQEEIPAAKDETPAPAHIRGFVAALLEGDREAVFAGLRQQVRGGGSPEQLVSNVVVLLDDAYRARVDGTPCDADIVRMTARFSTPTLEKLVASLTNAIDSSYTTNVTGAKLALTRALGVIGA